MKSCYRAFSTSIQIQTVDNGSFDAIHFGWRDSPQKALYAAFIYREYLFCLNHRGRCKRWILVDQNVCWLVCFFGDAGSHRCHDQCGSITVPNIVLKNDHRACSALLGADMRLHICKVNVSSEIFPIFWYDTIKPPLQYVAQAATPLKRLVQGKEYADKGGEYQRLTGRLKERLEPL
jgi:hypothetical protein